MARDWSFQPYADEGDGLYGGGGDTPWLVCREVIILIRAGCTPETDKSVWHIICALHVRE
jgi:hypothetical protein